MKRSEQMSEAYLTGAVLAAVGGFLDAYTYLCRGGVFANAQTGNVVLLSIGLARGRWPGAAYYLIPITAFAAGVLLTELLRSRYGSRPGFHWRQAVVLAEMAVLLLAAALPGGWGDTAANVLVSFTCAMQVESFRKVRGTAFATTMCTGNLRSATEGLYRFLHTGDREALRESLGLYGIILWFALGAALGAPAALRLGRPAAALCLPLLAAVFLLLRRSGGAAEAR